MEYIDIYDTSHNRTDKVVTRDTLPVPGERYLVVHICIFNAQGEMLIQRRHPLKDRYGGCWDVSAGGFAQHGEDSVAAILRESYEELGIHLMSKDISFILTAEFSHVLDDFYYAKYDIPLSDIKVAADEITEIEWASQQKILQMIRNGEFVDYHPEIIRLAFAALA